MKTVGTIRTSRVIDAVSRSTPLSASTPCVSPNDPLTRAIELMVEHNMEAIPVMWNRNLIGEVRLKDALARVGLPHVKD